MVCKHPIPKPGWIPPPTPPVHRASDLLQYVPHELRIASLDVKSHLFDFDEENARREEDILRTARALFWTKEFARAAFTLKDCKSSKGRFLALYTKFLVSHPNLNPDSDTDIFQMTEKRACEDFERITSNNNCHHV